MWRPTGHPEAGGRESRERRGERIDGLCEMGQARPGGRLAGQET